MIIQAVVMSVTACCKMMPDVNQPSRAVHIVQLWTPVHFGDFKLSNANLKDGEADEFARWARSLQCGQKVHIHLGSGSDK